MAFGRKIGPTGRKRDDFNVFALGHKRKGYPQKELNKPRHGSTAYTAYGQGGVREAKQSVHHTFPHRWVKFSIHNLSRTHRKAAKRRGNT